MLESLQLAITTTVTNLSAAKEIASSFLTVRDLQKYGPRIAELLDSIIQAKEMIITMQNRESMLTTKINELEKEIVCLKDWHQNKEQYERRDIASGVSAYINIKHTGSFENAHKLCCNCFNKNIEAPLQQTRGQIKKRKLVCPNGCPPVEFQRYIDNSINKPNE